MDRLRDKTHYLCWCHGLSGGLNQFYGSDLPAPGQEFYLPMTLLICLMNERHLSHVRDTVTPLLHAKPTQSRLLPLARYSLASDCMPLYLEASSWSHLRCRRWNLVYHESSLSPETHRGFRCFLGCRSPSLLRHLGTERCLPPSQMEGVCGNWQSTPIRKCFMEGNFSRIQSK